MRTLAPLLFRVHMEQVCLTCQLNVWIIIFYRINIRTNNYYSKPNGVSALYREMSFSHTRIHIYEDSR